MNNAELFRVQKWSTGEDKWAAVRRSKGYLAAKFLPPFDLKEGNLKQLFAQADAYNGAADSEAYIQWKEKVLEAVPRLNHDVLVQFALHLAFDAKVNDKEIWRAVEDASIAVLHHMNITQISQLEWATMELKPKQVTPRLNTLLMKRAIEAVDGAATASDLIDIIQGFRQRKSKDLYQRVRKALIAKKAQLYGPAKSPEEERKRAETLVNLLYTFASNKPQQFGMQKAYAAEDVNELLAHYEAELKEVAEKEGLLDGDHLTCLAQTLYILKSGDFEGVFRRIETSAVRLHAAGKLDIAHVTNILRAFVHAQENRMAGSDKVFFTFESTVLKGLEGLNARDATHLMYAYGVRAVGNPELHKDFEKKLEAIASTLDYPSLFNAFYYMLFTESGNRALWQKLVDATVANGDILPIIYYRPFKAAKFYMEGRFTGKDAIENMNDF